MPRNVRGPSDQPLRAAAVPDGRMSLENLGFNRLTKNRRSSNMGKGVMGRPIKPACQHRTAGGSRRTRLRSAHIRMLHLRSDRTGFDVGGSHEEKPVNIDRSDHRPGDSAASAVAGLPANYGGRVSDCHYHPHRPAVDGRICKSPARPGLFLRSPGLPTVPIVDFLAGLIFRVTVSLLEFGLRAGLACLR